MKIVVAIVVLLIILGVGVGLLAYFTDGFDFSDIIPTDPSDPADKPLDVEDLILTVDGEELTADCELPKTTELRIDVNADEFTVEILPSSSSTVDFRHNGSLVKFPYVEGNFNGAFGVEIGDGYFTMNSSLRSMYKVLSGYYDGEDITEITSLDPEAVYFVVRISGNDEIIEIPLTGFYEVFNLTLDKTEIIF